MKAAALFTAMGRLIEAIGAKRFPAALAEVLRLAVPYSHTVIFGYLGAARPLDLFDDFPTGDRKVFVTDYLEGPYLLDPFYLASSRPMPLGLYRMHDLAPDRFYQGEYYHNYYAKTGLAEEIGFFIDIALGEVIVVSLMLADRVFATRDLRVLHDLTPVVLASGRRHWFVLRRSFRLRLRRRSMSGGRGSCFCPPTGLAPVLSCLRRASLRPASGAGKSGSWLPVLSACCTRRRARPASARPPRTRRRK